MAGELEKAPLEVNITAISIRPTQPLLQSLMDVGGTSRFPAPAVLLLPHSNKSPHEGDRAAKIDRAQSLTATPATICQKQRREMRYLGLHDKPT